MANTHTRIFGNHPRAVVPFAFEMLAQAHSFLDDAKALKQRGTCGQFYLYSHAIELGLKSYLHLRGVPIRTLFGLSHNLVKAQKLCLERGAKLGNKDTRSALQMLTTSMEKAKLRYQMDFELPSLQLVDHTAEVVLATAREGQLHLSKEDVPINL